MGGSFALDQIGVIEGTDKSSTVSHSWDYLRHYEKWLASWRDQEINIIEIGVDKGQSLGTWLSFFPRARIIGVDINPECSKYAGDRVSIEIGSQDDPGFLHKICTKYPPSIIIDDGSHQAHHIIYTFEQLFPKLAAGGVYIIEDMAFHYGSVAKNWAPVEGHKPTQYFLDLADACLGRCAQTVKNWGTKGYCDDNVDSVYFISSAICINKKQDKPKSFDIEGARQYAKAKGLYPDGLLRYCQFVRKNGGSLGDVEAEFQNVDPGARSAFFALTLGEFQMAEGRVADAVKTLSEGVQRHADDWRLLWRYGHYLNVNGDAAGAVGALEKAGSLCNEPHNRSMIYDMLIAVCERHKLPEEASAALKRAQSATGDAQLKEELQKKIVALTG